MRSSAATPPARAPRARTSRTSSTPAASSSTEGSRSPPSGCAATAELIARTPADGLIAGTARINGDLHGERAACAVLSYDYTVLAGTQGAIGHRKKDRLFELIERMRLPTVLFAEGGGGRPGDTDYAVVSALDTRAFALWGRLSGIVPRIAIVAGRCFAGNAVLAGASDLIVATESIALGMGGPAMIEGGGLGSFEPERDRPARRPGPERGRRPRGRRRGRGGGGREAPDLLLPGAGEPLGGARPVAAARAGPGAPPPRLRRAHRGRGARRHGLGDRAARALRPGDADRAGADRGPAGGRDRQQSDAARRRDHQRRRRQGGAPDLSSATPSGSRSSR